MDSTTRLAQRQQPVWRTHPGRVAGVQFLNYPDLRFELLGSALAKLDWLNYFDVTDTALSGTIPRELGGLAELQTLLLYDNPSLSGSIPSELGDLTALGALQLYSNPSLSGSIPSVLGSLMALQFMCMHSDPALSGTIPRQLGGLSVLTELLLYENPALSGSIPSALGDLTELQKLDLHSNLALSGSVPSLTGCRRFEVLDLHNCSLTALPASLRGSITHLYLNHNPIDTNSANLSSLLGSVSALHVLDAGFINFKVQLQYVVGGGSDGTVVTNPGSCHTGAQCVFVLAM